MYVPEHFAERRVPVLHAAIRRIGFATLVTAGAQGIEASHVPLLLDPEPAPLGTLLGHIARENPQARHAGDGEVLAIFLGANAYVSPSWYPSKATSGSRVVPTWNYAAVHAYGPVAFFEDAARLEALVTRLTALHEAGRPAPWSVADAPRDYLAAMLKAIVGFAIPITRLEGKWKMSQNRPPGDRAGVAAALHGLGASAVAAGVLGEGDPEPA
ncbi:MAG TPA: FMN-binding negative transcriptional regulator [Stellaceae bacterium]|nr:FMN-binding negative transcriptional regulator [Stellaceae bacterium]